MVQCSHNGQEEQPEAMSSLLQSTDGAQKKWVDSISTALLHALGNLHVQLFVPAKGTLEKSSSDIQDVARPPFCMPSSHDAKKRQGHSLEEALMVESLGIASTRILTTTMGLKTPQLMCRGTEASDSNCFQ